MAQIRHRLRCLTAATTLAVAGLCAWQATAAQSLEFPVKANYLVRFAAFVDWPADAFATATTPISICISGTDPFGTELTKAIGGQTAHDRPIAVRRLGSAETVTGCHIVYVGRASRLSDAALRSIQSQPVLVVTDEINGDGHGAIHFVVSGDRVRFRVDQTVLPQGVVVDSRLLSLALSVRSAP